MHDGVKKAGEALNRFAFGHSDAACTKYLRQLLGQRSRLRRNRQQCIALGISELRALKRDGGDVGVRACGAVLAMLAKFKCASGACEVMGDMRTWGVPPTLEALALVVKSCASLTELRDALRAVEGMFPGRTRNLAGHAMAVVPVSQLLLKAGHRAEALQLLVRAVPEAWRTPAVHAAVLEAQPSFDKACEVFASLPHPVPAEPHHALLKWCAHAGRPQVAEALLLQMQLAGLHANTTTYHRILRAYAAHPSYNVAGYRTLCGVMNRIEAAGLALTAVDYGILIQSCVRTAAEEGCEKAVEVAETAVAKLEMAEREFTEPAVYTALLQVYAVAAHGGGAALRRTLRERVPPLLALMGRRRVAWSAPMDEPLARVCAALDLDAHALTRALRDRTRSGPVGVVPMASDHLVSVVSA